MPQTPTRSGHRRAPRPWWFRLGGWALALSLIVLLGMLVIDRGSYGATTHTVAATAAAPPSGSPAPSLTLQAQYDSSSYLAGSVIAQVGQHGVVATDAQTGEELWKYERTDTTVCAQRVNAHHVTLIYASGERCDEAVSFDPSNGSRQWQRTIEAVGPNEIRWGDASFISLDPAKMIVYEDKQGFERFTLDNSKTDHIEGEHTSCENLGAAGTPMVATLQRCRATADEQWVYQVVVNEASDGDPREVGRGYLTSLSDPALEGMTPDGTAVLRDDSGTVYALPLNGTDPTPIAGLPAVPGDDPIDVLASRGTVVLSTESTAYGLAKSRTSVAWSTPIVAAPYSDGARLYIPTAAELQERDAVAGGLLRSIMWDAPTVAPAEIIVSGNRVGLRDAVGLRVYS